jgi:hypothetical protein
MSTKADKVEKVEKSEKIEMPAKSAKTDKTEKTERPKNPRADVMPDDGFVLAVDGKLKTRFETSDDAMSAGLKLKQTYPVIQVAIFDATAGSYTPVVLPEK